MNMKEKGQALVELALFLPIILAILVLLVEVGFLLYDVAVLQGKVREVARYAAKGEDYFAETTSIETSGVFTIARQLRMITDTHVVRVTYAKVTNEGGELIVSELQETQFGVDTNLPDVATTLIQNYEAIAAAPQKHPGFPDVMESITLKTTGAVWAVVDAVYTREMVVFPIRATIRLPARSVFRVAYHTLRERATPTSP